MTTEAESYGRMQPAVESLAVFGGMVLFALFAHGRLPWILLGALGLLVVAVTIGSSLRRVARPATLLGLDRFPRRALALLLSGGFIGVAGGIVHRHGLGMTLWPTHGIEIFVMVACLVGAAEEALYRGWLLGRVKVFGWPAAVVIAAVAHASYKTALFASPAEGPAIDLAGVMLLTVLGGVVLGLLRVGSSSVLPAVFAHAVFDFVVYGELGTAPWWVWS